MAYNSIPERWLLCPRKGEVVEVNEDLGGFVPMKTMLDDRYNDQIPIESRWTPEMMLARYEGMSLLIDLTKTSRYYDKQLFPATVHVQKIECQGHGAGPDERQVKVFIEVCKMHWARNPKALIGVHCTHGFNRTGFMIVAFLVEEMAYSVEDAIRFFTRSRPPGIYKDDYIRDLCQRYDGDTDGLIPVPTPAWSVAGAEQLVRVKAVVDTLQGLKAVDITSGVLAKLNEMVEAALKASPDSSLRELLDQHGYTNGFVSVPDPSALYSALAAAFTSQKAGSSAEAVSLAAGPSTEDPSRPNCEAKDAIPGNSRLAYLKTPSLGPPHLGPLRKMCREMVGAPHGATFPGAQPVSLSRENIDDLRQHDFHVSWKSDGTRYLMLIRKKDVFLIGRDNNIFHVPGMHFVVNNHLEHRLDNTLVDGELVEDVALDPVSKRRVHRLRFYIFDMICCLGKDFKKYPYHQRLDSITREIIKPRDRIRANPQKYNYKPEPFGVRLKPFVPFTQLGTPRWTSLLRAFHNGYPLRPGAPNDPLKQLIHGTDGLLLAQSNHKYEHGTCGALLKYKPPELNSIDFRFVVEDHGSKAEAKLFVLHGNEEMEFTDSGTSTITVRGEASIKRLLEYDKKIVECTWASETRQWKFHCVRTDKSHPNALSTAQRVRQSIKDNIQQWELERIAADLRTRKDQAGYGRLSPRSSRKMQVVAALRQQAEAVETSQTSQTSSGAPASKRTARLLQPNDVPDDIRLKLGGLLQLDEALRPVLVTHGWGTNGFEVPVSGSELRRLASAIEATINSKNDKQ
eukprot:m.164321 g.164321  ORF g.164321 m.164321 type:complete len:795 (+) comp16575_c0_seq1:224-2608(+)